MVRTDRGQFAAFVKKELLEAVRTGKLTVIAILFVLFGMMNPAIAKLMPWMMRILVEDMPELGFAGGQAQVTVDALTSWMQFYKNIPMALLVLLFLYSSLMAAEYQKGTLICLLTKGMSRWKILAAKGAVLLALWTAGYWISFGITYGYNEYFWKNEGASHIVFAAACLYLFGVWILSLLLFFAVLCKTNSSALIAVGGVFLGCYLLGLLPKIKTYLPVQLLDAPALFRKAGECVDYERAVFITILLICLHAAAAVICFRGKDL